MSHCYLCGVLLDKSNSSVEHIIPNALGGNLKSRQLLCKKCNSDIGHQADSELAKQLNFFANMLRILDVIEVSLKSLRLEMKSQELYIDVCLVENRNV